MRQNVLALPKNNWQQEREKKKREYEESVLNNFQKRVDLTYKIQSVEQQELHEIAHTYNLHNKNHYETRLAALEDVLRIANYTQESYTSMMM